MADGSVIVEADVAVIGGGPSGMMAAIHASRSGARVVLIEKLNQPGVKLLSTGGGHCNLTNTDAHDVFTMRFGRLGRLMRSALSHFDADALRAYLAEIGCPTHLSDGHLVYPVSESARAVRDALHAQCVSLGVEVLTDTKVEALVVEGGALVALQTNKGMIRAARAVIACGGAAHPEMGSAGDGYDLAKRIGHSLTQPVPALVPILIAETHFHGCAGISLQRIELSIGATRGDRVSEAGDLLFTHRGISGPAALNLSGAVARVLSDGHEVKLRLDMTPDSDEKEWIARLDGWRRDDGAVMLRSLLARHFPARVAAALVGMSCEADDVRASQLSRDERHAVVRGITALELTATGTEGFARAMATSGGVSLDEVDARTLESRLVGGVHFAGEVLDLDGPCGGYNLQWAFSSGALAGSSACASLRGNR